MWCVWVSHKGMGRLNSFMTPASSLIGKGNAFSGKKFVNLTVFAKKGCHTGRNSGNQFGLFGAVLKGPPEFFPCLRNDEDVSCEAPFLRALLPLRSPRPYCRMKKNLRPALMSWLRRERRRNARAKTKAKTKAKALQLSKPCNRGRRTRESRARALEWFVSSIPPREITIEMSSRTKRAIVSRERGLLKSDILASAVAAE